MKSCRTGNLLPEDIKNYKEVTMKKNTVQKLLAIGLSCILSVGMLAGCGSKTESGAGAATGEAGGAESTPAAESTADTSASTDKASGDIPT